MSKVLTYMCVAFVGCGPRAPSSPSVELVDAGAAVTADDAGFAVEAIDGGVGARSLLPDPAPLVVAQGWEVEVSFDKGNALITAVRKVRFGAPTATSRKLGRFALELWVGETLVDRVRFNFPLVFEDGSVGASYEKGLSSKVLVIIPDSERPTRLELVDRASDRRSSFRFPPIPK